LPRFASTPASHCHALYLESAGYCCQFWNAILFMPQKENKSSSNRSRQLTWLILLLMFIFLLWQFIISLKKSGQIEKQLHNQAIIISKTTFYETSGNHFSGIL
jgi:hypothetical protein